MIITFSRQSCPMDLGSTRTSKTEEFGWLMWHHIFFNKNNIENKNKILNEIKCNLIFVYTVLLTQFTDHLMK